MKSRSYPCALAALLVGMAAAPLHAQTLTYNNGGSTGLWSTPANWTASSFYPNAAGVLAQRTATAVPAIALDVNATVGGLRNTAASASTWTMTNTGGFTLTLDGTGLTNGFGNANTSEIRAGSSGGLVSAANLSLANTNLDIGTVGSNNVNAQITLSGTITATTNQTITVRDVRRGTNLQGNIGTTGLGNITIVNLTSSGSADAAINSFNISGNLGSRVVQLTQGAGTNSGGTVITGANSAFTGNVSVLANSITVGATGTLGDLNTVSVSNGASLILQNVNALGDGSSLWLGTSGSATLSYSGTMSISALSLDGGSTFAPAGSIWGKIGSGAPFESSQFFSTSTGFLEVAAIPEPSTYALALGAGVLLLALKRRRRGCQSA